MKWMVQYSVKRGDWKDFFAYDGKEEAERVMAFLSLGKSPNAELRITEVIE